MWVHGLNQDYRLQSCDAVSIKIDYGDSFIFDYKNAVEVMGILSPDDAMVHESHLYIK
jgi:hypothetical protein